MPSARPFALLLAVPALLAGCSAGTAPTSTPPPPAITANATPVATAVTSAPPSTASATPSACPSGEYQATGFSAVGASSTAGKGTVKDVDVTFRNGTYTFEFDEDDPITLTLGTQSGRVRIDGEIRGSYSGTADALTFKLGGTSGTARFTQGGKTGTVSMKQVAAVLAPQGKGSAVCSGNDLTLTAGGLTWNLVRDDD